MSIEANKKAVHTLWNALTEMDWETMKSCLTDDVHYEDVPTEDPGIIGGPRSLELCTQRVDKAV